MHPRPRRLTRSQPLKNSLPKKVGSPTHTTTLSHRCWPTASTRSAEFDEVETAVQPYDVFPNRGFLQPGDPRGAHPSTTWVCNSKGETYTGQVTVISAQIAKEGARWRLLLRRNVVPCVGRAPIVDAERAFVGATPGQLLETMPFMLRELIDAPELIDALGAAHTATPTVAAWKWVTTFVLIPAGRSAIGCVASADSELACFSDEPAATARSFVAFEVMRSEVAAADFAGCVDAGLCAKPTAGSGCNYGVAGKEQHPINCVTWTEARAFCAAAHIRLPTPDEWEHAARGSTATLFPWGDAQPDSKSGNLCDRNCPPLPAADEKALPRAKRIQGGLDDGHAGTAPVGSFPAGVLDLAGNVWEWTDGEWRPGLKERRGGSFIDRPRGLRIGNRNWSKPDTHGPHGFSMLALIAALVWAGAAQAATTTLVGPTALDGQLTSARGVFSIDAGRLTASDAEVFWDAAAAETDDGEILLEASVPTGGEVGVVVRASWDALDVEGLDGYVVVGGGGKLRVERMDRGVPTVLQVVPLPMAQQMRLAVTVRGAQIDARVGAVHVVAEDSRYRMGRVGLHVHGSAAQSPVVVELLRLQLPQSVSEVPSAERIPSGDLRMIVVDDADLPRVDTKVRRWSSFKSLLRARPRTVLVMNAQQRAALAHDGVVAVSASSDVPWRAFAKPSPGGAGGYLDVDGVEAALRGLALAHPDVARVEQIGRSVQGRPLLALVISDGAADPEPAFLLNGAHHGSELMSVDSVLAAARWLLENRTTDVDAAHIVRDSEVWCVPLVNPDGLAAFFDRSARAGRKNGRDVDGNGRVDPWDGVDLNRNYPFEWGGLGERASRRWPLHRFFRGAAGGSEPETQAMMGIARDRRFVAAISFHTLSTVLLAPYTVRGARSPEPDAPRLVGEALVAALPVLAGQRAFKVGREIYAVDGTDQDWHRHQNGTLAYILEGRRHNTLDLRARAAILDEEREVWRGLLLRVLDGPTLRIVVTDDADRPLDAVVTLDVFRTFQGERWRTRGSDGSFFSPLASAVKLRARAEAVGHASAVVDVAAGATDAGLILVPSTRSWSRRSTGTSCMAPRPVRP